MTKEKLVILLTVLVTVIGFGIVIPVLPFYVEEFGARPTTITLMFASFSLVSFLSAPFLGDLSDRIGRRPVLIGAICMTAIGWVVFAGAGSVPLLFLGRMIDGAGAGSLSITQSYLVDLSKNEKERAANLGLIGAAFGIGFMLGPMLGGVLSTVSHSFPFWVAAGLAILNAIFAYFFLPESLKEFRKEGRVTVNPIRPLLRAAKDRNLRPLYISWVMFSLAFVTSQSVFALYVHNVFAFDSFQTGSAFTAMGLIVAVNQAVLLKYLWLRRFTERTLEMVMLWFLFFGLLAFTVPSLWAFALAALLMSTGQSVLRVVLTSQVAGAADPTTRGQTLGILASLMAACMATGPVLAGPLFEVHDTLPYYAAAGYIAIALVAARRFAKTHPSLRSAGAAVTVSAGAEATPL
ncbi:MAG: MFS transporter [Bacteroidota bacterium]